ncbi:VWA domain-containing protein [Dietzia psychralcaliphila]|uniref:Mg-protoporphyrin IX chelatase n=1 Tax=Dietzia psychralcaliphila TaxID=139021 RepID=A0AAD0NPT9_9ACTN|nr:VWA domain-containing protein [Dietzia psychralcaliphila]AWH94303.1 magnesium chelatase [Dietzia psychralcaliphila]PTM87913.1 magnesium chelatase subunit D [Dietzia psychralcaliphila]
MPLHYPFSAVVGSDDMALALLLNAVSPTVGGVLIRGEKGTAKSTMVRALAGILPQIEVVAGDRFSSAPDDRGTYTPDGPIPHDAPTEHRPVRLVELPIGATEDRIAGSLHLEKALSEGVTAFEPGLLARAHRGLLYVDEVNLLHDHVVDQLLDAAAMGRVTVERDGVSVEHAARFVLIGTMNPEEGELRPQLLDRFGLTVEVSAPREAALRAEVIRRRIAFDSHPEDFSATFAADELALRERIVAARDRVGGIELTDWALTTIATVCAGFDVDGMRADIVTARTAAAHAAWEGRTRITRADIRVAARMALPHRRRRAPFDAPGLDEELLDRLLGDDDEPDPRDDGPGTGGPGDDGNPGDNDKNDDDNTSDSPTGQQDPQSGASAEDTDDAGNTDARQHSTGENTPASAEHENHHPDSRQSPESDAGEDGPGPESRDGTDAGTDSGTVTGDPRQEDHDAGENGRPGGSTDPGTVTAASAPYRTRLLTVAGTGNGVSGRRSRAITTTGRRTGSAGFTGSDVHLPATIRAAAPQQAARGRHSGRDGGRLLLSARDLRSAVREGREANLVLFCVDASGSMAARTRMEQVKTAILSLLLDAYRRRDKVGLVTFRGSGAQVALPPTSSVDVAAARLAELPAGGRTPLAEGLLTVAEVLRIERVRDPQRRPLVVVVTDGRATHGPDALARSRAAAAGLASHGVASVVVDCESGRFRMGLASELATHLGAEHIPLGEVTAEGLTDTVRARTAPARRNPALTEGEVA